MRRPGLDVGRRATARIGATADIAGPRRRLGELRSREHAPLGVCSPRWPRSWPPRWLTPEPCNARPRRPSTSSWGRSPRHAKPADCPSSSSTSSRRTFVAAFSSTASLTSRAVAAATRLSWPSPAGVEVSAHRASAGACRTSRLTSSTKCCPRCPSGSGSARCRGGCATRWGPTADSAPTYSRCSSPRCDARFDIEPSSSWGCARSTTRRSVRSPSCSGATPRCGFACTSIRSRSMASTSAIPRACCAFTSCRLPAHSKSPTSPAGPTRGSSACAYVMVDQSKSSTTTPTSSRSTSRRSPLAMARPPMIGSYSATRPGSGIASSCIRSARTLPLLRRCRHRWRQYTRRPGDRRS